MLVLGQLRGDGRGRKPETVSLSGALGGKHLPDTAALQSF